jgi:hypothetical protein
MGPYRSHEVKDSIDDLIRKNPEVDGKIGMSDFECLCRVAESQIYYPSEIRYWSCRRILPRSLAKHSREKPSLIFSCLSRLDVLCDPGGIFLKVANIRSDNSTPIREQRPENVSEIASRQLICRIKIESADGAVRWIPTTIVPGRSLLLRQATLR